MNKITLIGNLTHTPEVKTTQNGTSFCSFTIAVNRRFPDANGERITDFFRITTWKQLAETCGKYLAKGRKVAVVGELQARLNEGKSGKAYLNLDVAADEVEFLSPREGSDVPKADAQPSASTGFNNGFTDIKNPNDLPF